MSPSKFTGIVLLCLAVGRVSGGSYFAQSDRDAATKLVSSSLSQPVALQYTYYAVEAAKKLNMKVEGADKTKICDFAKGALKVYDAESIFYYTSISEGLSCGLPIEDKVKAALKTALGEENLHDVAYGVAASLYLKNNKKLEVSDQDIKNSIDRVLELEENGIFKRTNDDTTSSLLYTGLALDTLAQIATNVKLNQDEKDKLSAVLENADSVVSAGVQSDSGLEFTDPKASTLRVTATVFKGLNSLSKALNKKVEAVNQDTVSGITNTLLKYKDVASVEDLHFVLEGLTTAASNNFYTPLVLSVVNKSLSVASKGTEGYVRVRVTNVFGEFATKAKVFLLKAYPQNDESKVLISNQEVFPVEGDTTTYQFNLLGVKPEPGFYVMEFRATPSDKGNFINIDSQGVSVKVIGVATVSDVSLMITDSQDPHDMAEARKYKCEFGKPLDEIPTAEHFQYLNLDFKVKSQSTGKSMQVHQAFVRIWNETTKLEQIFVAQSTSKGYSVKVSFSDIGDDFYFQSGKYSVELIIGDVFVQNPISWKIADINVNYPSDSRRDLPLSPFREQPEIVHQFRQPEKRPPSAISMAFTAAVLSPVLVLLFGLLKIGANLQNFPSGTSGLFALGFQGCLAALFALYAIYWFKLNMMQTLAYLGILSVPTLFFAHRTLNELAKQKQKTE